MAFVAPAQTLAQEPSGIRRGLHDLRRLGQVGNHIVGDLDTFALDHEALNTRAGLLARTADHTHNCHVSLLA